MTPQQYWSWPTGAWGWICPEPGSCTDSGNSSMGILTRPGTRHGHGCLTPSTSDPRAVRGVRTPLVEGGHTCRGQGPPRPAGAALKPRLLCLTLSRDTDPAVVQPSLCLAMGPTGADPDPHPWANTRVVVSPSPSPGKYPIPWGWGCPDPG